jgi:hypothetical protein
MRLKLFSLVVMVLLLAGCFPAQAGLSTATVRAEPVRLPPTWTTEPTTSPVHSQPTATILLSDVGSTPTQFQIKPSEEPQSPTSVPEVPFSGIKAIDAQQLWAWGEGRIWQSGDGGSTWQQISPEWEGLFYIWETTILDELTAFAKYCPDSQEPCQLLRTLDGALSWDVMDQDYHFPYSGLTIFFDPSYGVFESMPSDAAAGSVYTSFRDTDDGGQTWNLIELDTPTEFMTLEEWGGIWLCNCGDSLTFDPQRVIHIPGNMARDPWEEFKVWISWDRGQNWSISTVPLPSGTFKPAMIDPLDPIFFNEKNGILAVRLNEDYVFDDFLMVFYTTEDGGLTWTFRSQIADVGRGFRFQASTEQDLFFVCGNDICASHNGALTWERIPSILNWNTREFADSVIAFDFGDPSTGWALVRNPNESRHIVKTEDGTYRWNADENRSLWKTEDGGWTWNAIDPVSTP